MTREGEAWQPAREGAALEQNHSTIKQGLDIEGRALCVFIAKFLYNCSSPVFSKGTPSLSGLCKPVNANAAVQSMQHTPW